MADTLTDLIKDLGEKSGSEVLGASEDLNDSLKAMMASMEEGSEGTFKASKELQAALKAMTEQAVNNIRHTQKLLHEEEISSEEANASIKRQLKVIAELNEQIEQESKTRELGRKDLERFQKAVHEVNDGLRDERELIEAKQRREKAAALERKVIARAEAREREKARREAAMARKEEAKSMSDALANRIGGGYVGQTAVGVAQGRMRRGMSKKGIAAAAGLGIGAALISSAAKIQNRALDQMIGRMANYGITAANVNDEIKTTENVILDVRVAALELGLDADQSMQAVGSLAQQTGVKMEEAGSAIKGIQKLVLAGVGSMDELMADYVYNVNSMNMSTKEARQQVEDLAAIGNVSSIQMDDFYKSVKEVGGAVGSLNTDHKQLAKGMAALIKQGDKLGLSYDRRTKAAKDLTAALTNTYDMGFATVNVEQELLAATQSKNKALARDAQNILDDMNAGLISAATAAEQFKAAGGTADPRVMSMRMEEAVMALNNGGGELVNAILGTQVTTEQMQMLKNIAKETRSGKTFEQAMANVESRTGKKAIDAFAETVKDRRRRGANVAQMTAEQLETSIAQALVPTLEWMGGLLKDIATTVKMIGSFFGKSPEEIEKERKEAEKEAAEEKKARDIDVGKELLKTQLSAMGEEQGFFELDTTFIERLAKDKGLQEAFRGRMRGGVSGARELALRDVLSDKGYSDKKIEEILTRIDPKRFEAAQAGAAGGGGPSSANEAAQAGAAGGGGPSSANVTSTKVMPNGDIVRTVEMVEKNGVQTQKNINNAATREAAGSARRGTKGM